MRNTRAYCNTFCNNAFFHCDADSRAEPDANVRVDSDDNFSGNGNISSANGHANCCADSDSDR